MSQRLLYLCGVIAPILLGITVMLGGTMRPGYSHLSETISELFSPGSPNKFLLDILHTIYALLLTLFGIGLIRFVRSRDIARLLGAVGATFYIVMGLLSVMTATIFPQDPWGTPPTFPGRMHIALIGFVGLFSLMSIMLIGVWFIRTGLSPGFGVYSFITVVLVILSSLIFIFSINSPIMGLTERIPPFFGLLWTFLLALWLLFRADSAEVT